MSSETRVCQNCNKDFIIEPDDFGFYEKVGVPPPTFCPECRLIRRLVYRNERTFHHRICEKCNKKIISVFSKESGIHIYCQPCWWKDDWDGSQYAMEYDTNRSFIEQVNELFHKVPAMSLYGLYTTNVGTEYANMTGWLKNCYMVTYSDHCENVVHGSFVNWSKDSVDNLMGQKLELCYETINCTQCYETLFSVDCEGSSNLLFCKNCSGCNNCFGSVNLKNKSYYIFNQPYSKEEYSKRLEELYPSTSKKIEEGWEQAKKVWENAPQKYIHGWRNILSSGDYLNDTKNAKNCFIGFKLENCRYCSFVTGKLTDTYDFTNFGENSELMYEALQSGDQVSEGKFSWWAITNVQNVEYCMFVGSGSNLFGCVGLRRKEYCILNKQYSKEDYFELKEKIIEKMKADKEYGEFFPASKSPFAYNETTAQEFFPLTKEQALAIGYSWRETEKRNYKVTKNISDLPEIISEVQNNIVNEVIKCEHDNNCNDQCTGAFKIIQAELQFYRRMNLPLPNLCLNCRHANRLKYRNPMKLWHRKCMNEGCLNEFETSYSTDKPDIVYCEKCYQQEVY